MHPLPFAKAVPFLAVVALALAGLPSADAAEDCVDYRDYVQYLDVTVLPERPIDVAVAGHTAYVAAGRKLFIVDLAGPQPTILATLDERAGRLEVVPPYLYVTGYGFAAHDFTIVDVADPHSPKVVGRVTTPAPPGDVAVQGNYAFVYQDANPRKLLVVDIADPTAPEIVAGVEEPYLADRLVISGHYLYTLSSITFLIFDISDPLQPIMVGTFGGLGYPWDVGVSGNYVYVTGTTDWAYGFQVYDATDVTNPVFVTYVPIPEAVGLDIEGDLAVVTSFTGALHVLDISDRAHPVLRASPMAHWAWDAALVDGVAYLPVDSALERVHIGNGRWVEPVGRVPSSAAIDLDVVGKCAYVLDRSAGLRVVNVGDAHQPQVIGEFQIGLPSGIAVRLPIAYVATGNQGLVTVDVSEPSHPRLAGLLTGSMIATDVALLGKHALLASTSGLVVVDVSQPAAPHVVAHLDTPALESIVVRGHYALAAGNTAGVLACDLADPEAPELADQIDTPGIAHEVVLDGNLAYVADQTGVAILEVSNPADLYLVGVYPTSGATYGVTGSHGLCYAADQNLGFVCIDATEPGQPVLVGRAELGGRLQRGVVLEHQVFAAANAGGLAILPAHCGGAPVAIAPSEAPPRRIAVGLASPNPLSLAASVAIAFDLPGRMPVRCEVFDVHGRLVRAMPLRMLDAGRQVATWDGRGERGPAPPGVYFARLRLGDQTVTRRVVVAP